MPENMKPDTCLRGPVQICHAMLRQILRHGDMAVDGTCGNGKDTLFLAELVGLSGHVWAFDIQEEAIRRTESRIADSGLSEVVTIIHSGHEHMKEFIHNPLKAAIFNLGWLPGGQDKSMTTIWETTIAAIESVTEILLPGGMLAITCYPGHPGGDIEAKMLSDWSAALPPSLFHAWRLRQLNVANTAPFCLIVQKTDTQNGK